MLLLATAAAEVPMSYVRVIEPYSPSRSEPAAFFPDFVNVSPKIRR